MNAPLPLVMLIKPWLISIPYRQAVSRLVLCSISMEQHTRRRSDTKLICR